MQAERRTNPLSIILSVLLVLALIGLAWFAWQWMQEGDRADTLDQEVTNLRQQAANTLAPDQDTDSTQGGDVAPANDTEQILATSKAYTNARVQSRGGEMNYAIEKQDGDFALVGVTGEGSGHKQVLKKVNGTWVVVIAGQQLMPEDIEEYGVPQSIVDAQPGL